MIRAIKGGYAIISHTSGKRLATFKTRGEAEAHLKRMRYFKHKRG